MPRPWTTAGRNAILAGEVAVCFLFEAQTDEGTQRICSWNVDVVWNSQSWTAGQGKWHPADGIPISRGLVPETFTLTFDGAHENDTGEFIGLLLTRTWHQRPCIFHGLLLSTSDFSVIDEFYEWRGFMDMAPVQSNAGTQADVQLALESGVFRAQERNMATVGHNDQIRRDPTDTLFRDMARKQDQQIPYGISWSKIPGYGTTGGGGGGGGGGFGPGRGFNFDFGR